MSGSILPQEKEMLKQGSTSTCSSEAESGKEQGTFCSRVCAVCKRLTTLILRHGILGFFIILSVVLAVERYKQCLPEPSAASHCPEDWYKHKGQCYYFSKVEKNWTDSWNFCSAHGASLVMLDLQELDSWLPFKGKFDYWIGLRKDTHQVWRWANGTEFDNRFEIQGGADCAFLDPDFTTGSSSCSTLSKWICHK